MEHIDSPSDGEVAEVRNSTLIKHEGVNSDHFTPIFQRLVDALTEYVAYWML